MRAMPGVVDVITPSRFAIGGVLAAILSLAAAGPLAQQAVTLGPDDAIHFDYPDAAFTSEQVSHFEVSWDSAPFVSVSQPPSYVPTAGVTSYIVLQPFTSGTHTVSIRACNASGCGQASSPFAFVLESEPVPLPVPATVPSNVRVGPKTPPPDPDPDPEGLTMAHLWVDTNSGTCLRSSSPVAYNDGASCGSLDAAWDVARSVSAASVVLVKAGMYSGQAITGSRTVSSEVVLFQPAAGESVVFNGLIRLGEGTEGQQPGNGPDYVTLRGFVTGTYPMDGANNRYGVYILPGSSHVTVENGTIGGPLVQSSHHITFRNNSIGPCRAKPDSGYRPDLGSQFCELNKVDHSSCQGFHADCQPPSDIVWEGNTVFGFDLGPICDAQAVEYTDGCHHRSLYWNGVARGTIRGNTFYDSVFAPWTTHSGPAAGATGTSDLLVENNQFGARVTYRSPSYTSSDTSLQLAWCQNSSQPSYRNITVRFNSFSRGAAFSGPKMENPEGEAGCTVTNFKVYGNIFGTRLPSCGASGIQWAYNVYAGSTSGTCGTGDINIGGATMPYYTVDTKAPSLKTDFALTGALMAADNLVPVSMGCPATDITGTSRTTSGFCDAGAHER